MCEAGVCEAGFARPPAGTRPALPSLWRAWVGRPALLHEECRQAQLQAERHAAGSDAAPRQRACRFAFYRFQPGVLPLSPCACALRTFSCFGGSEGCAARREFSGGAMPHRREITYTPGGWSGDSPSSERARRQ